MDDLIQQYQTFTVTAQKKNQLSLRIIATKLVVVIEFCYAKD